MLALNFIAKNYIMVSANIVVGTRKEDRLRQSTILKYQDESEWVVLDDKPEERFCGYLYLEQALRDLNISRLQAAENKIAIYDRKIVYLSKFYGDYEPRRLELPQYDQELEVLDEVIKFTDIVGGKNLREKDGIVYVFDTEKGSFHRSVHAKIDAFIEQHNIIRSILEKSL